MTTYVRNHTVALALAVLLAAAFLCAPIGNTARAQEPTSSSITTMLSQVQSLMELIKQLQAQLAEAKNELKQTIRTLRTDIKEGMTDEDIRAIQELLATDPEIYPEGLATGYFGSLTRHALMRLQRCHGLTETGEIDEDTRELLEAFLSTGKVRPGEIRKLCRLVQTSIELDENAKEIDVRSDRGPNIRICHKDRVSISVGVPAARAHLAHGDTKGACGGENGSESDEKDEKDKNSSSTEEQAQKAIDEAKETIDDIEEAIDEAEGETDEAESLLTEAKEKLAKAEDAFDDEDWDEAKKLAEEAEEKANKAEDKLEDETEDEDGNDNDENATSTDTGTET